jgi:sulfhydrogenase subunit beta (sulfur reductase)
MVLDKYYISKEHWQNVLLDWMQEYDVFAPVRHPGGLLLFERADPSLSHMFVFDTARTIQPLKSFLFPAFEDVMSESETQAKPWLFLGVRACDLKALEVLDRALGTNLQDPHYAKRRKDSVIVGADCTQPYKTCFCTAVDGRPFASEGFDLNASKIWDGFVVEVGSLRGKVLLEGFDRSLKPLVKEEEEAQEKLRRETVKKVHRINLDCSTRRPYVDLVQVGRDSPVWENRSATCVECGACNFVCPTCYSFFIDAVQKKPVKKLRSWDACLLAGFDQAARPRISDRFRHRFFCKFRYQPETLGLSGCTGCGRCIEACPGKIDMRLVLQDLAKGQKSKTMRYIPA